MTEHTYRGVPVPPSLVPNLNQPEAAWWRIGADAALDVTRPLIDSLYDDSPCSLDHHGYCQAHGLSGSPCADAQAREFLEISRGDEVVWLSQMGFVWCLDHRPRTMMVSQVPVTELDPDDGPHECEQCGRGFV